MRHAMIDSIDWLGEHVAQFKFTVLLMPNGPQKITGLPFEEELYKSEFTIEDLEIQVLYWVPVIYLIYFWYIL